jgi:hypothetical protein
MKVTQEFKVTNEMIECAVAEIYIDYQDCDHLSDMFVPRVVKQYIGSRCDLFGSFGLVSWSDFIDEEYLNIAKGIIIGSSILYPIAIEGEEVD